MAGLPEMDKERRLALLLADGSGDFDYCRAVAFESMVILQGHVTSFEAKQQAESLARYVGFARVLNALRVFPSKGEAAEKGGSQQADGNS